MNNKQEISRYGHATCRPKYVHSSLLVALADPRLLGLDQLLLTSIFIPSPYLSSFFPLFSSLPLPIMCGSGGLGACLQRGPGAKPLVRGVRGAKPPWS